MSDQKPSRGHELEASSPIKLFIGLAVAATAMGLGVVFAVQMTYGERNEQKWASVEEGSQLLKDHKARVAGELEGIDEVSASVSAEPAKLNRFDEPEGFVHPDKTKGVGRYTPGLNPPPEPAPAPEPESTDGGDAAPDGEDDGADSGAADAPAGDAKPAPEGGGGQ
jgi:hypothetical protein